MPWPLGPAFSFLPGRQKLSGSAVLPWPKSRGETRSSWLHPLCAVSASPSSGGKRPLPPPGKGAADHPLSLLSSWAWGLPATFLSRSLTLHGEGKTLHVCCAAGLQWQLPCSLGRGIVPVQGWGRGAAGDEPEPAWLNPSAPSRVSRSWWLRAWPVGFCYLQRSVPSFTFLQSPGLPDLTGLTLPVSGV